MHRILIVDDEPIIVNSLYQILQQAMHLDLEIYRAYHAYEALERLDRTRVDLVVSDIRMPGMDGLELQRRIVAKWPWCKIVFLTGYNEFEYMQTALRNGGIVDYLLKNEDDGLIVRAVEKALKEIELQETFMERVRIANARHHSALSVLRRNALLEKSGEGRDALRGAFAQSEIPLSADGKAWAMAVRYDEYPDPALPEEERELLRYACGNILGELLEPSGVFAAADAELGFSVWAIQPKELPGPDGTPKVEDRAWDDLIARMGSVAESAQEACREWLKLPVSFALGNRALEWSEFGEEARQLTGLLKRPAFRGKELLVRLSPELSESEEGLPESAEPGGDPLHPKLIRTVHDYVRDHLDQELSLGRLAELVHHSPTYLSRLYRRLTGITLFEYITDRRMGEAKRLLRDSRLKIHEIAAAVGYESAPHFTRFFKKQTGLTPQEFRDLPEDGQA